jgi:phospholipid transport system substrate-binding protein
VTTRHLTQTFAGVLALGAWVLALAPAMAGVDAPAAAATVVSAAQRGPQELMDDVSKRMFAALDANRAAIRKDPDKVFALVDQILLPNFDTEEAARLVLTRYWKAATPEQQGRFIKALYTSLLHTYGNALADFTAERLKLLPFKADASSPDKAVVRTQVTRSSGAIVAVDYRMHKTESGWKVYDVVIEGIDYVRNYRVDLGAEADAKGLNEVITRLEREGIDFNKSSGSR